MNPTEVKKHTGHSSSTIYKAKNGELKNQELSDKILTLLNLEKNYLEKVFTDDRFIKMCEIAITKSKSSEIEVRKFAVLLQHHAISLKTRSQQEKQQE